jgi:hypothetical protein
MQNKQQQENNQISMVSADGSLLDSIQAVGGS